MLSSHIFGAFEAAKYPGLIHSPVSRTLRGNGYIQDVFDTYVKSYSQLHSWDTKKLSMKRNFHVVNETPECRPTRGFSPLAKKCTSHVGTE